MKKDSASAFALRPTPTRPRIRQRKQPIQERSQITVEAILEGTLQLLLASGMAGLTTTAIAARAGVSVGTLYQYFPDKQAVLTALWVRFLAQAQAAQVAARAALVDCPADVAVGLLITGLIEFKRAHLTAILALKEPMASLEGAAFSKDLTETLYELTCTVVVDPFVARIAITAVEGALTWAIDNDPMLLHSDRFRDELISLARAYITGR